MVKDLSRLVDENGIYAAVAVDQRGALRNLLGDKGTPENLSLFKKLVSEVLTPHGSSFLVDPEYGLDAAKAKDEKAGLILSYEQTGYDQSRPGRLPRLIEDQSVRRLVEAGADAVKFLLYYDVDEADEINQKKQALIERVGTECQAENVPFLLEILTYDDSIGDEKGEAYAKVRPHKVNEAMRVFSEPRFQVDTLKVEIPVNMNFVEGFGDKAVMTQAEAAEAFKAQDAATNIPYIYLSGGVSAQLFMDSLQFAADHGAHFNGILCGRATWKGATTALADAGEEAAKAWLESEGLDNLTALNEVNVKTATPVQF
ncbi:tagatose 1,6-diphosphate aldolase [Staphylococcus intermedius]|uniref:Tagatose 1,6-diphosphate aldolase n=1 Tax=Staphylococcus intermedius NCTC 11048 TaxID=1141106 RepID=A0A380G471_STAIN|nr:tagatose 1,6-diphosphate aldolase [Staphylococcus intermedius]PCF64135.1 tagatose-bisphosphate aldolase [Staphylococcus intermedius]PCF78850.1 tagatose-bisphosphate aldolase [Staphylococcus intermedius]PCF79823.1 tagatose-bisphosphate aldolase [Staphylococcus intermedius]PNZ54811.1 tagatose 1,6-diphosphate aldolase [Staphylococcus intermedius NCTC 11048]SUM45552.1 tagatose 1,6-diphosphate aldolase [Staphylococcus intermedius NCTC 11048]